MGSTLTDPQEWLIRAISGMAQSATGITVTPLKAMGVACVFGCVRVLADTLSSLPLEIKQTRGRKRRIATEHPLYTALKLQPNEEMSSRDWRWAVQANASLFGSGYSRILRQGGLASGAYPLESSRVDFSRDERTKQLRYKLNDTGAVYGLQDMLHIKTATFNGTAGMHILSVVQECVALAIAMQDNAAKFFGNGSRPNGVLKHPLSLSTDAQNRLKAQFEEEAGGKNLYRLMLLEEGLEYVATRSENKDSQFLESADAQNLQICRVFGVPPHKLGILNSQPRANIEEENIGFVMDRMRPICVGWEQEMDRKMFSPAEIAAGYHTHLDLNALMRGNRKARFETYGSGRQWGILTANDCRAEEGLDDVEGGDVLLQPTNMVDSTKATEYLMKSKDSGQQASQKQGGNGGTPNV